MSYNDDSFNTLQLLKDNNIKMSEFTRGDIIKRGKYWFADIETKSKIYTNIRFDTREEATLFLDEVYEYVIQDKKVDAVVTTLLAVGAIGFLIASIIYILL